MVYVNYENSDNSTYWNKLKKIEKTEYHIRRKNKKSEKIELAIGHVIKLLMSDEVMLICPNGLVTVKKNHVIKLP